MKNKNYLTLFLSFLLTLSFSGYAQEMTPEEIEAQILQEGESFEVLNVSPEDPLLEELVKDENNCEPTEETLSHEANNNLKDVAVHLVKDTGAILLAPLGWSKEDWLKVSAIAAGLMILSTQDDEIRDFSQSVRSKTTEKVSFGLEKIGNGGTSLALLGAAYVSSLALKNQKLKNTSLTAIEGLAVAAVLTTLGKNVFHRERPYSADDQFNISGPGLSSKDLSFPSGHTGSAFAIATVFAEAYGDKKLIPILAYSAATLAGISRIHDNKHWATDVVGGAVLGYAAGKFVSNRRLNKNDTKEKIQVTPSFALGKGGGMNLAVNIPVTSKKKMKEMEKLEKLKELYEP